MKLVRYQRRRLPHSFFYGIFAFILFCAYFLSASHHRKSLCCHANVKNVYLKPFSPFHITMPCLGSCADETLWVGLLTFLGDTISGFSIFPSPLLQCSLSPWAQEVCCRCISWNWGLPHLCILICCGSP